MKPTVKIKKAYVIIVRTEWLQFEDESNLTNMHILNFDNNISFITDNYYNKQ